LGQNTSQTGASDESAFAERNADVEQSEASQSNTGNTRLAEMADGSSKSAHRDPSDEKTGSTGQVEPSAEDLALSTEHANLRNTAAASDLKAELASDLLAGTESEADGVAPEQDIAAGAAAALPLPRAYKASLGLEGGVGVAGEKLKDGGGNPDEATSPQQGDAATMAGADRLAIQRGMRRALADPSAPSLPVSDPANLAGKTDDLQPTLDTLIDDDGLIGLRVLAEGEMATSAELPAEPTDLSLASLPREPSGPAQVAFPTELVTPPGQSSMARTSSAPDSAFSSSEEPVAPPELGGSTQTSSAAHSAFSSFAEPAAAPSTSSTEQVPSVSDSAVPSPKEPVVPPESTSGPLGSATSKPAETESVDGDGQVVTS
jgi:hypothetical protein